MQLDQMEFGHRFYINHAISLLLANRPYLLSVSASHEPESGFSARDARLLSLAHFMRGESLTVDFFGKAKDMEIEDLDCLIMALEVIIAGRMRATGEDRSY